MTLIAPHLLQPHSNSTVNDWPTAENGPINQLDLTIFRSMREKLSKKKENKNENNN